MRIVLVVPLLVAVVGIVAVFFFANRSISEPAVEPKIARYVEELKAIGAAMPAPVNSAPDWTQQTLSRLAHLKAHVQKVDSIAREIERELATRSSGCVFAKADSGAIDKDIGPATTATKNALDALISGTKERIGHLTDENTALGWTGWRGSREEQISELWLLAHDIETTTADADLAFTRLNNNATALTKVSVTCP